MPRAFKSGAGHDTPGARGSPRELVWMHADVFTAYYPALSYAPEVGPLAMKALRLV